MSVFTKIYFTVSFAVLILNILDVAAGLFKNTTLSWPGRGELRPDSWLFLYPALLYQVWFWCGRWLF